MSDVWPKLIKYAVREDTIVEDLLEELSDLHCKTQFGSNVLHLAATNQDNQSVVFFLIEAASFLLFQPNQFGEYPLHWACKESPFTVIKAMITHGSDVNARDGEGNTPLHWAAEYDRTEVIQLLQLHNATLLPRNCEYRTAYDVAVFNHASPTTLEALKPRTDRNST